jgi:hypothetical protein
MLMTSTRPRRLLAGLLATVATVAAFSSGQAAQAAPTPPAVPTEIAVPDGHKPFLLGHAAGVQIYTCTTVTGGHAWSPATPSAVLRDDHGRVIATHFGGPSWRATDGSTVVASRDGAVIVDPTAIAWLRLKAAPATPGPDGDRLVGTTYIQRIATTGGLTPPAADCNATTAGAAREVPYTADYLFWKERTS